MKVNLKRVMTSLLVTAMVLATLTGCTSAKSSSASGKVVNITHWVWLDNPSDPTFKNMVKEFNSTHSTIHVNLEVIPYATYNAKLLTAAVGGGLPDTSSFKLTWVPEFIDNDSLEPLDSYISKWKSASDIPQSIWNDMKVTSDKKDYALPWELQVLYMYYRPSLFKAAGVQIPQTWNDFLTDAQKLTVTKNGKVVQYGFGMRGAKYGQEPWGSFVFSNVVGNNIMLNGKAVFNTPAANQANNLYLDLFRKYHVVPATAPNDGLPEITADFLAGKTAMMVHHIMSSASMVKQFGNDVSAFEMPAGTQGRWTSLGDTENVMFKTSKNKAADFTWISWLSQKQQIDQWDRASGNVPVVTSVQAEPYYQNNRFMKVSFASLPFAHIYPATTSMGPWIESLWPATEQEALTGKITGEQMMKTLSDGMNKN